MNSIFDFMRAALPWITTGLLIAVFLARGASRKKDKEKKENYQVFEMAVEDSYIRVNPSNNALNELKRSHLYKTEKRRGLTVCKWQYSIDDPGKLVFSKFFTFLQPFEAKIYRRNLLISTVYSVIFIS